MSTINHKTIVAQAALDVVREDVPAIPESWDCVDCGVNTAPGCLNKAELEKTCETARGESVPQMFDDCTEVYAVRERVWAQAVIETMGGCLCIGCLEKRLDRKLRPKDFRRGHPLNMFPGTPRLLKRRGR